MKLCILDRDGTINSDSDDYVKSPEEWQPLPGALEAIARLTWSDDAARAEAPAGGRGAAVVTGPATGARVPQTELSGRARHG